MIRDSEKRKKNKKKKKKKEKAITTYCGHLELPVRESNNDDRKTITMIIIIIIIMMMTTSQKSRNQKSHDNLHPLIPTYIRRLSHASYGAL